MSRAKNIAVDATAFVICLIAAQPSITGPRGHEWIGIAATVTLIVHLFLHRAWVATVARRLLKSAAASRVNFVLDAAIAASVAAIAGTGLAMSHTLAAPLGLEALNRGLVLELHETAGEVFVMLALIHLVLHRTWITRQVRSGLNAVRAWVWLDRHPAPRTPSGRPRPGHTPAPRPRAARTERG